MKQILGIDISKATFDVALTGNNQTFHQAEFANTPKGFKELTKWLNGQDVKTLHACLEATGRYGDALATFLHAKGDDVSMVNPSRVHAYGQSKLQRNTTDRLAARLIADFCYTQQPELWTPPSTAQRELQELSREITNLKEERQRKRNKLKSGIDSQRVFRSLERHIGFIEREIAKLEDEVQQLIKTEPELMEDIQLLTSIPAISTITAVRFLAEVDVSHFQQASQVAAYAGLAPREHSSGTSVHKKPRISKIGNRHLRTAFYMPALSAHRHNPIIRALVDRLSERGKSKMTIIGAVMRKLLHLAFGVLKTRKPFDPNHLQSIPVGG